MGSIFKKWIMRNYICFLLVSFIFLCCTTKKQESIDTVNFLDIPIRGEVLDFANQLEQNGFKKDADFDGILNSKLYGDYDGYPCTLVIGHSMKGEVLSVYIKFDQEYEILQKDERSKESFIDLNNVDSLKHAFTHHKECLEKTYSMKFEEPTEEKDDSATVIPSGQSKWLGSGFVSIYPRGIANVFLFIHFRGSGDDKAINEKEIEENKK